MFFYQDGQGGLKNFVCLLESVDMQKKCRNEHVCRVGWVFRQTLSQIFGPYVRVELLFFCCIRSQPCKCYLCGYGRPCNFAQKAGQIISIPLG